MVVHVGLSPNFGQLAFYSESEKITSHLKIIEVNSIEIEKVNLMYNETKVKIDEELGYVCICLDGGYGNKMRKKFIEEGLNCGFKNVEIINYETAFYLNAMSRIDYKPSNGDIIWIEALCYFYVWKITNVKAEFIGKWKADSTNLADLQNIVIESKLKKGPDVLLAQYKMKEKVFNGISICQFFSYTHYRYSYLLGTLIKAQITAVGIDLGTSRCCAAVNRKNGIVTVQLDNTGERLLPSYVAYDEENVKCGRVVVNRLRQFSKSTVFDSKRIIGRNFNDIEIDSNWPFRISENNGKMFVEVKNCNGETKQITAEEVAADLLKHIKQKTEEFQGEKIAKVVITVPAAFSDAQKDATSGAANLNVDEYDTTKDEIIAISREEFENMTKPLLNRIRNTLDSALLISKLAPENINKILLVGGGSRMPMIKNLLKELFPKAEQCIHENPDEVVAIGAAYYAHSIFSNN
uniref:Uncharacterized protein n=1 Tax=Panagrolaimus sp. ES5 TaxID=591445 RepID=A0AC34F9Q0_9BILA